MIELHLVGAVDLSIAGLPQPFEAQRLRTAEALHNARRSLQPEDLVARGLADKEGPVQRFAVWVACRDHHACLPEAAEWTTKSFDAAVSAIAEDTTDKSMNSAARVLRTAMFELLLRHEEVAAIGDPDELATRIVDAWESPEWRTATGRHETENLAERAISEISLPRYDVNLARRAAVASWSATNQRRGAPLAARILGGVACMGTLGAIVLGRFSVRSGGAAAIAVIGVAATLGIVAGPLTIHALLPRLFASCAVGMAFVVTVLNGPRVFKDHGPRWYVPVTAAAACWAYLLVEARLHRLGLGVAVRRTVEILIIGLAYAWLLALIAVAFVLPALRAEGWPAIAHRGDRLSIAATVAAASLLIGSLVQVLWDDRSIAAPLGRRVWRSAP